MQMKNCSHNKSTEQRYKGCSTHDSAWASSNSLTDACRTPCTDLTCFTSTFGNDMKNQQEVVLSETGRWYPLREYRKPDQFEAMD